MIVVPFELIILSKLLSSWTKSIQTDSLLQVSKT